MNIPKGWKLVPEEPTVTMLAQGCRAGLATETLLDDTRFACDLAVWKAMLAAAPEPPEFTMEEIAADLPTDKHLLTDREILAEELEKHGMAAMAYDVRTLHLKDSGLLAAELAAMARVRKGEGK